MLETIFANPGYLAAGGALISSPIIIHLINRMRFKRLRWAAMEFLLKAQKRNRRRLIIEQLLLLLLRCMLVALLGLLVSRLVPQSAAATGEVLDYTHIVLVDNSLSMNDQWRDKDDNNKLKNCLGVAQDLVLNKIIHPVSRSSTNDRLILVPLSEAARDPEKFAPIIYQDLSFADKRGEAENALKKIEPTYLHLGMGRGLAAVKHIIKNLGGGRVIVHIFTDLRQSDWAAPHGKKLQDELKELAIWQNFDKVLNLNELKIDELKVIVRDTAHPYRSNRPGAPPPAHDNLAITDFRAASRVAGKDMPVVFTVMLANYGTREAEVNVDVYDVTTGKAFLDIDFNPTMPIKVAPGSMTTATFDKRFAAKEGMESYFIQLMAKLEDKRGQAGDALAEDNIRYTTLEIRNKVPVLVIDGEGDRGQKEQQDSFFIRHAINSIPGESNTVVFGHELPGTGGLPTKALERADLSRYPAIFLLNVRELTDPQIDKLDKYVKDGGGLAFFLGPQVSGKFYKEKLYKEGTGMFPVPLADTFFPPANEDPLKPAYTGEEQLLLREDIFPTMEEYPILGQVFKEKKDLRKALRDFPIKRYFKVPRDEWKPQAGVKELATLPSDVPVVQYQKAALTIFDKLRDILKHPDNRLYAPAIGRHEEIIRRLVAPTSDKPAHQLAKALTDLVEDKGKKEDSVRFPDLKDGFWNGPDPKARSLRGEILQLRDQVKFGDPFVVLHQHGNGKVLAVMTTAGKEWNDWAGGSEASIFYQPFIWEALTYLTSQSTGQLNDVNRLVGDTVLVTTDVDQYRQKGREPRMQRFYHKWRKDEAVKPEPREFDKNLRKQEGTVPFKFDQNVLPGIYVTHILYEDDPDDARPLAAWAHAFNVDTAKESNLARVGSQEFESLFNDEERARKLHELLKVQGPADDDDGARNLQNERPWDFSESPWLFLIFLGILVAEQALAVHLSFHLRSEKGEAPIIVVRPASRAAA